MGPVNSSPSSGSLGSFPPPSRLADPISLDPIGLDPIGLDESEICDVEEAALASLPRSINWYAVACRILGVLVIGCAVWSLWWMAQHPPARGAMIDWVSFGKAH